MRNYYIFSSGRIRRKDNSLELENEKGKTSIPIHDVDQLFFFGEIDLNSKFLNFCSQHEIILHFFNYYGMYTGTFYSREKNLSGYLRVRQSQFYLDPEKRLEIARKFIEGSISNIRRTLEKREGKSQIISQVREKLKKLASGIPLCKDIPTLMSLEAHSRKEYYSTWEEITGWELGGRQYNPPSNELNTLISFGNALLYSQTLKEIYRTPLDPTISYLHEPSERRYSLALDISELFKPLFVDRIIFKLIGQTVIKKEHFSKELNGTYLFDEGRKVVVQAFDQLLETTIMHRGIKRKARYSSFIRFEAYKLVKHLLSEKEYKPLKAWW